MPGLPHAPSIYLDDEDLGALCREVSERLRRHQRLRSLLDRLIGNRWEDFEAGLGTVLGASLFETGGVDIDLSWLSEFRDEIGAPEIEAVREVFLDACLIGFPLYAASAVNDIGDRLGELIGDMLTQTTPESFDVRMRQVQASLRAGALLSRL
jgi:hypothetical protein